MTHYIRIWNLKVLCPVVRKEPQWSDRDTKLPTKPSTPNVFCPQVMQVWGRGQRHWLEWPNNNQPTWDQSHGKAPVTNTTNDILSCLQTGACCPLRSSTQQLTQTDTDTHSQTVDGAWGLLWKNRRKDCNSKGDRNSTGRPTESTNLDPWGFQRLNHQPKNIHRLDLGLPTHMQQMCILVFMWVPQL